MISKLVKQGVVTCLDGKERYFAKYDDGHIIYMMYKNGEPYGHTHRLKQSKMPEFVTIDMVNEVVGRD